LKLKKVIGLLIIAISVLIFSVQVSIAELTMYIDQTTPEFWTDINRYIPSIIYVCTAIAIVVGAYLIFSKDNTDKN